jgi:carboxylate-amine ligase
MDCQECPAADMATLTAVIETVKALVNGKFLNHEMQMGWKTEPLVSILDKCTEKGMDAIIDQPEYLSVFNVNEEKVTARELWESIFDSLKGSTALSQRTSVLEKILRQGNLAQRIVKALEGDYAHENLVRVYRKLTFCLEENKVFEN